MLDKNELKSKKGFRAYTSKGVDQNGAKCNMGFRRVRVVLKFGVWSGLSLTIGFQVAHPPLVQRILHLH